MKIYLFRHGESEDNRQHLFSGWRNPPLSEKGRIDAAELAELLKGKEFAKVYTPHLVRNRDTVKEIAKYHPLSKVIYDDRLKERCYGDLQGRAHLEIMREDLTFYLKCHRSYETRPPGGESIKMVEKRVTPFYEELVGLGKKEKMEVAICAGNNAMRVLRRLLEDLTVEQMLGIENPYDNYFEYDIQ